MIPRSQVSYGSWKRHGVLVLGQKGRRSQPIKVGAGLAQEVSFLSYILPVWEDWRPEVQSWELTSLNCYKNGQELIGDAQQWEQNRKATLREGISSELEQPLKGSWEWTAGISLQLHMLFMTLCWQLEISPSRSIYTMEIGQMLQIRGFLSLRAVSPVHHCLWACVCLGRRQASPMQAPLNA